MSPAFAYVKSTVLALVFPPVPFLVLLAMAWQRRQRRWAPWAFGVALLGIWLSCTEVLGEWLIHHGLGSPPALRPNELREGPSTAILVLGAGVREGVPEYGRASLKPLTEERLHYGVWLARQRGWPLGITGGIGWAAHHQVHSEASVVTMVLREQYGLSPRWAESSSRDTQENAAKSLPLLHLDGVQRVVLVTHDVHMPRALRAFREQAAEFKMDIVPAPVGMPDGDGAGFGDWLPSVRGFLRVHYALYEMLAGLSGR